MDRVSAGHLARNAGARSGPSVGFIAIPGNCMDAADGAEIGKATWVLEQSDRLIGPLSRGPQGVWSRCGPVGSALQLHSSLPLHPFESRPFFGKNPPPFPPLGGSRATTVERLASGRGEGADPTGWPPAAAETPPCPTSAVPGPFSCCTAVDRWMEIPIRSCGRCSEGYNSVAGGLMPAAYMAGGSLQTRSVHRSWEVPHHD